MKLHVLGGGDEVGASMLLLESSQANVVVDCGIRMSASAPSPTPDLSALEGKRVDAIVVTHAHLDHTGALPLLHSARPDVPVYCTPPTAALMRVLLLDAVKIMDERLAREDEIPLYPVEAVESLLARVKTVPFGATVLVGNDKIKLRLFPAGHILGAAMAELSGPGVSALFTGDISQADQHTVAGLAMPRSRPCLLVAESTYGGRMHADRRAEENRFVAKVRQVIERGGKLVVPAFALGRAQELLMVLLRAIRRGELEPIPVYADGMVRGVCAVYGRYENYLPPFARKQAQKHGNPFFGPEDSIQAVSDAQQRDAICSGPPCVVVASSGMLTGGASVAYVERLAGVADNCIAITGYQDEEAPGRRLLELAQGDADSVMVNGKAVSVACEVEKYGLSAHIDGYSLLQLVGSLAPDDVVWVHGDGDAREWLHSTGSVGRSHCPKNGEALQFEVAGRRALPLHRGMGGGEELVLAQVPILAAYLRRNDHEGRLFRVRELLDRWYGEGEWAVVREEIAHEALSSSPHFESCARGKEMAYRLMSEADAARESARSQGPSRPDEVQAETQRLFPKETGMYRAKQYHAECRVALCFHFPRKARDAYRLQLEKLAKKTGWTVEVHPQPHMNVLLDQARKLVSPVATVRKASFLPAQAAVEVKVDEVLSRDVAASLVAEFAERTGYGLVVSVRGAGGGPTLAAFSAGASGGGQKVDSNTAFQNIAFAFEGARHRLLKKSKKTDMDGEYLELRFVTPQAGEKYKELVERLSEETGWRICMSPNVTPQELQRMAVEAVGEEAAVVGEPKIYLVENRVVAICEQMPDADALERSCGEFLEDTGFVLEVRGEG